MTESINSFPTASVTLTDAEPGDVILYPARNIVDRDYHNRYRYSQYMGEEITYQVDMTRLMADRGVTVTAVTWSSDEVDIPAGQLTGDKARATLCPGLEGIGRVKMVATQSDGNTRIVWIEIRSIDPSFNGSDY